MINKCRLNINLRLTIVHLSIFYKLLPGVCPAWAGTYPSRCGGGTLNKMQDGGVEAKGQVRFSTVTYRRKLYIHRTATRKWTKNSTETHRHIQTKEFAFYLQFWSEWKTKFHNEMLSPSGDKVTLILTEHDMNQQLNYINLHVSTLGNLELGLQVSLDADT